MRLCLSGIIFLTQCLLVHAIETDFWAARAQSIPVRPSMHLFPPRPSVSASIHIPYRYMRLDQKTTPAPPTHQKTLLFIQDIHMNLEAQKNIQYALKNLSDHNAVDFLALEGEFGPVDLNIFHTFKFQNEIRKVAAYLLEQGKLSGAIVNALAPSKKHVPVVGVDDERLYKRHVEILKSSIHTQTHFEQNLRAKQTHLEDQIVSSQNKRLREFHQKVQHYRAGKMTLSAFAQYLHPHISPSSFLHINNYVDVVRLEKQVQAEHVLKERQHLMKELNSRLSAKDLHKLSARALSLQRGDITEDDFYQFLLQSIESTGLKKEMYPHLSHYAHYLNLSRRINGLALLEDVYQAIQHVYDSRAVGKKQKQWAQAVNQSHLQTKMADLSLTSFEWSQIDAAAHESNAYQFYKQAELRDHVMAANVKKLFKEKNAQLGILVSGGFHLEGVRAALRSEGIQVVGLVPRISQVQKNQKQIYLSAFQQNSSPLDALFQGQTLFLSPRPTRGLNLIPRGLGHIVPSAKAYIDQHFKTRPQSSAESGLDVPAGSFSYLANFFSSEVFKGYLPRGRIFLNVIVRSFFILHVVPHELGRLIVGPQFGTRLDYGWKKIVMGIVSGQMPWESQAERSFIGIKANIVFLVFFLITFALGLILLPQIFRMLFFPLTFGTITLFFGLIVEVMVNKNPSWFGLQGHSKIPLPLKKGVLNVRNFEPETKAMQLKVHQDWIKTEAAIRKHIENELFTEEAGPKYTSTIEKMQEGDSFEVIELPRVFDGGGSGHDLPDWISYMQPDGSPSRKSFQLVDMPSVVTATSNLPYKLKISALPLNEDGTLNPAIEFVSKSGEVMRWKNPLKDLLVGEDRKPLQRFKDAPAYIFYRLFHISGVRIEVIEESEFMKMGGMEGSSIFVRALVKAASQLSHVNLSDSEINALALVLENDAFDGHTGGQGLLSASTGGVYWHFLTTHQKGYISNKSVSLLDNDQIRDLEKHVLLVQPGIQYKDGVNESRRRSGHILKIWQDVIESDHPYTRRYWQVTFKRLAIQYAMALGEGNHSKAATVLGEIVKARNDITLFWQNRVLDVLEGHESNDTPEFAKVFAEKLKIYKGNPDAPEISRDPNLKLFIEWFIRNDGNHHDGKYDLRKESLYAPGKMRELIETARKKGIGAMPTGAGGEGSVMLTLSPHGVEHMKAVLKLDYGIEELSEQDIKEKTEGDGFLKGYIPIEIGEISKEVPEDIKRLGMKMPSPAPMKRYNQRNGTDSRVADERQGGVATLFYFENVFSGAALGSALVLGWSWLYGHFSGLDIVISIGFGLLGAVVGHEVSHGLAMRLSGPVQFVSSLRYFGFVNKNRDAISWFSYLAGPLSGPVLVGSFFVFMESSNILVGTSIMVLAVNAMAAFVGDGPNAVRAWTEQVIARQIEYYFYVANENAERLLGLPSKKPSSHDIVTHPRRQAPVLSASQIVMNPNYHPIMQRAYRDFVSKYEIDNRARFIRALSFISGITATEMRRILNLDKPGDEVNPADPIRSYQGKALSLRQA